jgi:hypothetical protein
MPSACRQPDQFSLHSLRVASLRKVRPSLATPRRFSSSALPCLQSCLRISRGAQNEEKDLFGHRSEYHPPSFCREAPPKERFGLGFKRHDSSATRSLIGGSCRQRLRRGPQRSLGRFLRVWSRLGEPFADHFATRSSFPPEWLPPQDRMSAYV